MILFAGNHSQDHMTTHTVYINFMQWKGRHTVYGALKSCLQFGVCANKHAECLQIRLLSKVEKSFLLHFKGIA